ncbi:MAG: SpoIIE family protein phosphatase [Kiritimatiellae bacterium]|nr:SpoIIE family protein phosphatase [Kiritimatiellia bacterium]
MIIDPYSGTKILVVDDERLILLTMSAKLKKGGYTPIAVSDMDSAVKAVKDNPHSFSAIITDIMMGEMDGFMLRDIVRGLDTTMPMFFLTALDPEEGGRFLKRILEDPQSYYLPKSVNSDVLLKRIQRIVASRKIERFIESKMEDDRKSLELAANIQKSMLPARTLMTPRGCYSAWWRPMDVVSGDLYEAVPFGLGCYLYIVGDIQGHGTSAALAMTAVQSFLKHLSNGQGNLDMGPADIANLLQGFFRTNLADVSYMTAVICIHRPLQNVENRASWMSGATPDKIIVREGERRLVFKEKTPGDVRWISCGAPDLVVVDGGAALDINPERRGGVPIGLFPDTVYTAADEVCTGLSDSAACILFSDGLMDVSRDAEGIEKLPPKTALKIGTELVGAARDDGSLVAVLPKFIAACEALGYGKPQDDMTLLIFGARHALDGVCEGTIPLTPADIDRASQELAGWCRAEGWSDSLVCRVQLVFEEKLMNVHDHGFDDRDRLRERASFRLRMRRGHAELTVWDFGSEEPSIQVVAGDSSTVFEKANMALRDHGRGRLMVRELCDGIERNRFGGMNESIYHIPEGAAPAAKK